MINQPNPRIAILEDRISSLADATEGMDLFTVINVLCDHLDEDMVDFTESRLYWDIMNATQSNPKKSHNAILRMIRMDSAISRYDTE